MEFWWKTIKMMQILKTKRIHPTIYSFLYWHLLPYHSTLLQSMGNLAPSIPPSLLPRPYVSNSSIKVDRLLLLFLFLGLLQKGGFFFNCLHSFFFLWGISPIFMCLDQYVFNIVLNGLSFNLSNQILSLFLFNVAIFPFMVYFNGSIDKWQFL